MLPPHPRLPVVAAVFLLGEGWVYSGLPVGGGAGFLAAGVALTFTPLWYLLGLTLLATANLCLGGAYFWTRGVYSVLGLAAVNCACDFTTPGGVPELWGSPIHVLAALLAFLQTFCLNRGVGVGRSDPENSSSRGALLTAGLALLLLGLVWNYTQNLQRTAWAWDWIEAVPFYLIGGLLGLSHLWARSAWHNPTAAYLVGLQAGRMALTQSLHHTAPPLNPRLGGLGGCALVIEGGGPGLWLYPALLSLSLAVVLPSRDSDLPPRVWGLQAAPRGSKLWPLHLAAASSVATLVALVWGVPLPHPLCTGLGAALLLFGGFGSRRSGLG